MLELLSRFGGAAGLRTAGRHRLATVAKANAPRMGATLVEDLLTAPAEQGVVDVPSTRAAETVLPRLADDLATVLQRRKHRRRSRGALDAHPLPGS